MIKFAQEAWRFCTRTAGCTLQDGHAGPCQVHKGHHGYLVEHD